MSVAGSEITSYALGKAETAVVRSVTTGLKNSAKTAGHKTSQVAKHYLGKNGTHFDTFTKLGLKDGMKCPSGKALELGEQFLGKGYKEVISGSGRYVSSDGKRVFRMGANDILGKHGGGPHVNFETLIPSSSKQER